jgi:hypothetical protein
MNKISMSFEKKRRRGRKKHIDLSYDYETRLKQRSFLHYGLMEFVNIKTVVVKEGRGCLRSI